MEIIELEKDKLANKKYSIEIKTNKYLDIVPNESGFSMKWIECDEFSKKLEDEIFSDWLDNPVAYGTYEDGVLIGFVEGFFEEWNKRYRISNIVIFDEKYRHSGIGKILLDKIIEEARKCMARMVVLETQSYNYSAISFYIKNGFEIIGFDRYAYTNTDPKDHNMRIEMGMAI